MHTTEWTDPDSGVEYRIHHNGDFSGDAFVCVPEEVGYDAVTYRRSTAGGEDYCEITLPGRLLVDLARSQVAGEIVGLLEERYL